MTKLTSILTLILALIAMPAAAQERVQGPVFTSFGLWMEIENAMPVPPESEIKAIFDTTRGADPGTLNGRFDSAARFVNLLVANGVPEDQIKLAVVVHGPAIWDVTNAAAYARKYPGQTSGSTAAIAEMVAHGVRVLVCGQSASGQGIAAADLLPGVTMTLSQTVATALLQAEGYQNIP